MWQYRDWTCCNVVLCRFTWNMPNSAASTRHPSRTKFKFCSWNSHKWHQKTSLSQARDGTGRKKRKGRKRSKENDQHAFQKWPRSHSFWLCIHHSHSVSAPRFSAIKLDRSNWDAVTSATQLHCPKLYMPFIFYGQAVAIWFAGDVLQWKVFKSTVAATAALAQLVVHIKTRVGS